MATLINVPSRYPYPSHEAIEVENIDEASRLILEIGTREQAYSRYVDLCSKATTNIVYRRAAEELGKKINRADSLRAFSQAIPSGYGNHGENAIFDNLVSLMGYQSYVSEFGTTDLSVLPVTLGFSNGMSIIGAVQKLLFCPSNNGIFGVLTPLGFVYYPTNDIRRVSAYSTTNYLLYRQGNLLYCHVGDEVIKVSLATWLSYAKLLWCASWDKFIGTAFKITNAFTYTQGNFISYTHIIENFAPEAGIKGDFKYGAAILKNRTMVRPPVSQLKVGDITGGTRRDFRTDIMSICDHNGHLYSSASPAIQGLLRDVPVVGHYFDTLLANYAANTIADVVTERSANDWASHADESFAGSINNKSYKVI